MPPKPVLTQPAAKLPGEADILASVVADLSDDTAKLVYADWLQERDDRGKLLRDCVTAFRAGKKLPGLSAAPKPWRDLVGITLMAKLRGSALMPDADTFLRLARPALAFTSAKAGDKLPVGTSKFGGRPDMPLGTKWPVYLGDPHSFLAQFNLADLSASVVCRDLPSSGLLSVFYASEGEVFDNTDRGGWRVFHFPNVSELARRGWPEGTSKEQQFRSCRLAFTEILTLPERYSPWRKDLGLGDDGERDDAFDELTEGDKLGHRILGYPNPLQNDPLSRKTMRHLLTIDSDRNAKWMWGDSGLLYFTIGEGMLRKQRFDRVGFEQQCC